MIGVEEQPQKRQYLDTDGLIEVANEIMPRLEAVEDGTELASDAEVDALYEQYVKPYLSTGGNIYLESDENVDALYEEYVAPHLGG